MKWWEHIIYQWLIIVVVKTIPIQHQSSNKFRVIWSIPLKIPKITHMPMEIQSIRFEFLIYLSDLLWIDLKHSYRFIWSAHGHRLGPWSNIARTHTYHQLHVVNKLNGFFLLRTTEGVINHFEWLCLPLAFFPSAYEDRIIPPKRGKKDFYQHRFDLIYLDNQLHYYFIVVVFAVD